MPRCYKRISNKNNWIEETLLLAIRTIKIDGKKIRATARKFSIPESTFRKRLKENSTSHAPLGRKPTFTADEEKELTKHVLTLSKLFYGLTPRELRRIVFEFVQANQINHTFNKTIKIAGKDWLYLFLQRNPEIALRQPEGTSLNRINAFNKEEVNRFFSNLQTVMEKFKFPPNRIFNMDETGITTVKKNVQKYMAKKGQRELGQQYQMKKGELLQQYFV